MHNKRQIISNFSDHFRLYNFQDQRAHQSSLEESPIAKQLSVEEDLSPEHIFYPSSLDQKNKTKPNPLNLKAQIIQLLHKLKDWLLELCLTEACTQQINEQLQPIIQQITETGGYNTSQYSSSINISRSRNNKIMSKSFIMKCNRNSSVFELEKVGSNYRSKQSGHQESMSMVLIREEQKMLLRLFFKNYHRLLENNLGRINKCSGEKKLKFLISTILRNIFSQTMRISYDLKLLQHKITQQKAQKFKRNRNAYIILLKDRLHMILSQRGSIKDSFTLLKDIYYDRFAKDESLVYGMIEKINKIVNIYQKHKKSILFKYTFSWRQSIYQMKLQNEIQIIERIREKMEKILSSLFFFERDKETFSLYWKDSIEHYLNELLEETFQGQDCLFVSLQEILKQKYFKKEKDLSVIEYLTEYERSTERNYSFKNHLFLNEFSLEQLKNCILSGEIYRNEKLSNNLLLVPIKSAPGIIFVRLSTTKQTNFVSLCRQPMNLNSFRMLLRIIQLISPLIDDLVNVCKKIEKDWQQVQKNNHFELLFKEYLRTSMMREDFGQGKDQFMIERHEEGLLIDSHRMQSASETINIFLNRYQINCLMVYHCNKDNIIQDLPCIIYGDKEVSLTQKYIVNSIFNELVTSGKEYLVIVRNDKAFNIIPIKSEKGCIGFINYTSVGEEKIDHHLMEDCLVPLILRSEGSINCNQCKISLKMPEKHQKIVKEGLNQVNIGFDHFSSMIDMASSVNICDLQQNCKKVLRSQGNYFFKMIYRININNNNQFFSIQEGKRLQFHKLSEEERVNHQQSFTQEYSNLLNSSTYAKLLYKSPCFSNPQLHIFQYENICSFRLQAFPIAISKEQFGYMLVGYYVVQKVKKEEITGFLKKISQGINSNLNIFTVNSLQSQLEYHEKSETQRRFLEIMNSNQIIQGNNKLVQNYKIFSKQLQKITTDIFKESIITIKLFKVNMEKQIMRCLNQEFNHKQLHLTKEIMEFLDHSIIQTHERIYAGQCNFSKKYFSSAIKPSKINHIFNKSIFYPTISAQANKQLKQQIKTRYKLQGWIANDNLGKMQHIYQKLYGKFMNENMYYALRIGGQDNKKVQYFAIIQSKIDQDGQNIFNQNVLLEIQQSYLKIYNKHVSSMQDVKERKVQIGQLEMMMRKGMTNSKAIQCFQDNFRIMKTKVKEFHRKMSTVLCSGNNKNKKYYAFIKIAFQSLKLVNFQIYMRNTRFLAKTLPIINAYEIKCLKYTAFNELFKLMKQKGVPFQKKKLIKSLSQILNNSIRLLYQKSLQTLKSNNQLKCHNKEQSKKLSIHKLINITRNIINKESHLLFQQFNKYHHIFSYYFRLITDEYQNVIFSKRQQFLKYSNERFNNIISHVHFGIVDKIEIMTSYVVDDQIVIHKIGQNNRLETYQVEYDGRSSQNLYEGFQMVPLEQGFKNHFVMYKLEYKYETYSQKEKLIVQEAVKKSLKPCYTEYLKKITQKAERMSKIVINVVCKEIWNGSAGSAQGVYAFGRNLCLEHQCDKLKVFGMLKSMKTRSGIQDLKGLKEAINQQSKIYYKLQYQHNALTNALSSGVTPEMLQRQSQLFNKYGQLITKAKLKQMRQQTQILQNLQQKTTLQYQIKSKTFSTSKIIIFCDKKQNQIKENILIDYLMADKQNISGREMPNHMQKLYVDKKMQLKSIKDSITSEQKMIKRKASCVLWITLSKMMRKETQMDKKQVFSNMIYPRSMQNKYRY